METQSPESRLHSTSEITNVYKCQKLISRWVKDTAWPSGMVIKTLHKQLMEGVDSYTRKGFMRSEPGVYRKIDLYPHGEPENMYVRGTDVEPLMAHYSRNLDSVLENLPNHPQGNVEKVIHDAAWAYYTYIRIHPFYDGNGRTGRMILKRIIKGANLRDLVFHDNRWNGDNRSTHLDAMHIVDSTGDLAGLELFLLESLASAYRGDSKSNGVVSEIDRTIIEKRKYLGNLSEQKPTSAVWSGFSGIDLYGNREEQQIVA